MTVKSEVVKLAHDIPVWLGIILAVVLGMAGEIVASYAVSVMALAAVVSYALRDLSRMGGGSDD